MKKMKFVAVLLLSFLSLGRSAPLSSCDALLKPVEVSKEDMLGKGFFIGKSSNFPGSRSLHRLFIGVWFNITATSQSNVIHLVQTQKILEECSSLAFDVIFENSTMLIEKPFYLKQVYLPTECANCLVAKEDVTFGNDSFTSLLIFSESRSVSSAAVEMLKKQAECLGLPSPLMSDPTSELCPESMKPADGVSNIKSLLEDKRGLKLARFLDGIFDRHIN